MGSLHEQSLILTVAFTRLRPLPSHTEGKQAHALTATRGRAGIQSPPGEPQTHMLHCQPAFSHGDQEQEVPRNILRPVSETRRTWHTHASHHPRVEIPPNLHCSGEANQSRGLGGEGPGWGTARGQPELLGTASCCSPCPGDPHPKPRRGRQGLGEQQRPPTFPGTGRDQHSHGCHVGYGYKYF